MELGPLAFTLFLHVLGASLWVGGTVTLVVVNRLLKSVLAEGEHARILSRVGRGATPALLGGLALAVLSGLELLRVRYGDLGILFEGSFWSSTFGTVLGWKAFVILASLTLAGFHGVLAARGRLRGRVPAVLGSATAALALIILALGAMLRWL